MFSPRSIRTLFLMLLCTALVYAQGSSGSLAGRILDPNGAAVPGAKVSIKSDDTGAESEVVASQAGYYVFPTLAVGPYTISVEQTGFKKLSESGINIAIATRSTLNITLQVGDIKQTVDVTADAPLLATSTSDLGTSFQPKFMKDAPLFVSGGFRNPENFIGFMPGVNTVAGENSINGGPRRGKEVLIDGASHTNPESGGVAFIANGGVGSVEMFGEFKLLTSNFNAEYGRSAGGIEIFVTKSGTNQIHGTAFDFLRNDKLDAAGWAVNQRKPFLGKSKVRQNEFGGAIGGPVFIPKVYDGRNKTFFYFTYNGYRQNNASSTGVGTVPTSLMKQGNFSELGNKQIFDPNTTTTVNGVTTRTPFAGNIIPVSRFSSVSSKILPLYPDPTGPGIASNYSTTSLGTVDRKIFSIKGDHAFSDKNRLSALYSWQRLEVFNSSGLPGPLAQGQVTTDKPDTTRVNHDYTFTPNLLNHATFGLSRYQNYFTQLPSQLGGWPSKLGLTGVATGDSSSFPIVTFTDGFSQLGNSPKTRGSQENWTYTALDHLSWIRGSHEFKFGYEFRRGRTFQDPLDDAYAQGLFNFTNFQTADPVNRAATGYSFASFLLGGVNNSERDYNTKGVNMIYMYHGGFAQDTWKINSKLTLTYGLRYEVFVPRTDLNLTLSAFDPTIPNAGAGGHLGAIAFAGEGPGRTGRKRFGDIYYNNFGPRVGIAYNIMPKTVIRAGYGMYYAASNGNTGGGCFPCGWGVNASPTPTTQDTISPVFNWDQGFNPGSNFRTPPIIDPTIANGSNGSVNSILTVSKEDGLAGRIQNWQFNIQHELPWSVLLDAAYIGSYSTRLNNYVAQNQLNPKYLTLGALLSRSITDPSVIAAGYTKPYDSFVGTLAQSLRPFPQYGNITHTYLGQGASTYNALQIKAEKRYSSFSLLLGYTWSKNIAINGAFTQTGNGEAPQDAYNLGVEKALSRHDIPQQLDLIYTWDLPFGKGKHYLSGANTVVRTIVSGWTIAGIQNYRSGNLLALTVPNTLGAGVLFTPALRAITTGQPILVGNRTSLDPNDPNSKYINVSAFALPAAYQFGTAAAYINDLRNPPFFTENLSLVKRTQLRESMDIELRADASNLLNRTNFGNINVNLADRVNFGRATGVQNGPRIIQVALKLNF